MLQINLHDVVNNLDFYLRATPTTLWLVSFRTRLLFCYSMWKALILGLGGSEEFFGSPSACSAKQFLLGEELWVQSTQLQNWSGKI